MNEYDIGDTVKVYTSTPFTDQETGSAFDPDTVNFKIKTPSGTTTTYVHGTDAEVIQSSTGDYYMLVRPDAAGTWRYRIEGLDAAGDAHCAEEGAFTVHVQQVS